MTREQRREQELYVADRPSRRVCLAPSASPVLGPCCPRCGEIATGKPGRFWCGECSAPVTPGRA